MVLSDVSFKAKAGQYISILGRVGSGKTTLLDSIAGQVDLCNGFILKK